MPLKTGPCDYLLLVNRISVGVVEAKKIGTTLSAVAEQTGRYASSLPEFLAALAPCKLPFLYESTGVETFGMVSHMKELSRRMLRIPK